MSDQPGKFVWYELKTSTPNSATEFYGHVFGWTAEEQDMPGGKYTVISKNGVGLGGLMAIPENACDAATKPGWGGYIWVDNVDAYAERLKKAGGTIHSAPQDIPGTGRFAVVADPGGAVFMLFKNADIQDTRPPVAQGTPGHVDWHELHAADGASAFTFYSKLLHWTKADEMDMGEMGIYRIFANGGAPIGGMMTKTADTPAPFWLYYFCVEALDAAIARVRKAGGKTIIDPMEVPGDMWVVQCLDPQGNIFALVATKR